MKSKLRSGPRLRHIWLFSIFGIVFFTFFYLYYGAERFQTLSFYAWLWVACLAALIGLLRYRPRLARGGGVVPDFDEDISLEGFAYILGVMASCFAFSMLWARFLARTALELVAVIYVPLAVEAINFIQDLTMQLSWQLFVVGWSEEILCYLLYVLGASLLPSAGKTGREVAAVLFSRGLWAVLHTVKNPVYLAHPLMAVPALVSGILFYLLLKATRSLPAAATAHGLVNFIVYTAGGG